MREVPQYVKQLAIGSAPVVQLSNAGANTTMRVSQEMGEFGDAISQNAEKVERMRAQATMRENMQRISLDVGPNPGALQQSLDKYRSEFTAKLPSGMREEFDAVYRVESLPYIDRASNKFNDNLKNDLKTESMRNFSAATKNLETATKILETSNIPEQRLAATEMLRSSLSSIAGIADETDGEGMRLFTPAERIAIGSESVASPIKALSAQGQSMALSPPDTFEKVIPVVLQNEGGYVDTDGNTGNPAIYGINKKWHPEAFKRVVDAEKKGQGQQAAAEYYKVEFWDKYQIEKLAPSQRAIVMDAAVNHYPGFVEKLIKEAKGGATPSELLQIREDEYQRLGKKPEHAGSLRGWMNRLKTFTPIAIGENIDMLDTDARDKLRKGVKESLEREQQLKTTDFAAWGISQGMDVNQLVQSQASRPFVQVIPNTQAKQIVESLKNYQTTDQFIGFANQLKQTYAGGERFAVQNLVQQGLEPEMEMALQLSTNSPDAYKEHIDSLFVYKQLGKEVDNNLKAQGRKPADMDDRVSNRFLESEQAEIMQYQYGNSSVMAKSRALSSMQAMAKGYLLKNPNASEDDAAEFAMKPFAEEYNIAKVNGAHFQVPMLDRADDVQRRMREYYKKQLEPALKSTQKGYEFNSKMVVPVLNEAEDGYNFVTVTGEPLGVSVSLQELRDLYDPVPNIFEQRAKTTNVGVPSTLNPAVTKRGK